MPESNSTIAKACNLPIEEVLCSKTRLKIIKLLMRLGQLNTSQIAGIIKANYAAIDCHLRILTEQDVLQQRMFGHVKLYRLKEESPRTKAVLSLVEAWGKDKPSFSGKRFIGSNE